MNGFPFFGPMTPEQAKEAEKTRAKENAESHRRVATFLPMLKDAQRQLREAAALGCGGHHFGKAQKHLAILVEFAETDLVARGNS